MDQEYDQDLKREAPCEICPIQLPKKATHIAISNKEGVRIVQQICHACVGKLVLHGADLDDTDFYEK